MKKVICFGTFDLLHLGHLNYFQQAKKQGDYLIVVIATDKTKQTQRKQTIFTEQERCTLVQSLQIVDEAVIGNTDDHFRIIVEKTPDIICLGYDHQVTEEKITQELAKHNLFPKIVRAVAYKPERYKSSEIKNVIKKKTNVP